MGIEITISIPDAVASQARAQGLSPEIYVERLLTRIAALADQRTESRAALRAGLEEDWAQFRKTGLHLNEEEVDQ